MTDEEARESAVQRWAGEKHAQAFLDGFRAGLRHARSWRPLTTEPLSWPAEGQRVLMRHAGSEFLYAFHRRYSGWFLSWATHWAPIPPPPKAQ